VPTRQQEFEHLALPHTRSLLRVARRLTPEGEDLVQETLLLAWRSFHQLQAGASARPWLFRILMNAWYGRVRKLRVATVPLESDDYPSRPVAETAADIGRALAQLVPEHRAVLLLGVVEGFTCQEMSEILGVPIGTVMSRMSRARDAMRGRLAPQCSAEGRS
jgi:RNA polymerase sigma-70 factor (ECF subfamily)